MDELKSKARALISKFKGESYIHGTGCLKKTGQLCSPFGKKVFLITNLQERDPESCQKIVNSLTRSHLKIQGPCDSARPNSPKEDVLRIKEEILRANPDCLLVASGGSGIDAAKAANILSVVGGNIDSYFGVGKVSEQLKQAGKSLLPCVAVQTASSSAAHLTKYANITDSKTCQKKIIVDESIVPPRALFDYGLTTSMSASFTCDGAFDSLSHCLEVFYGASPGLYEKIQEIVLTGIDLILSSLEQAVAKPSHMAAREALGLASDLGGYAIMVGGTNGPHLTSFSLVDILSHGRACALLAPYYTVFFSPSIQKQLAQLAALFARHNLTDPSSPFLKGRKLGVAVAEALIALNRRVGFPTALGEIEGMNAVHIERALRAAKNPQLEMKLKNMPIPLTSRMVDEYMKPVLEAAVSGDFSLIKNV